MVTNLKKIPLKKALIIFTSILFLMGCDSSEDRKGRFLLKGNVKMKENDFKSARDFYNEALKIDPDFAEAYYNRGITFQMVADYPQAIQDFTRAISIHPDYADAYYQRSLAYLDHGENYNSLEDAKYLIQLEQSARGQFLLGLGYEALANYKEALKAFSNGLQLDEDNIDLYVNRATIYYYLGEMESSLADLKVAESLNSKEPNIYNLYSMIAFDQENYQAAYDRVQQAIALNSSQPFFYNNRGLYQLYLGKLEEGLEDINLSIKQNSNNLYALRNKGIYYSMTGNEELASKYLQEVFDRDPDLPLTGEYLEKLGDLPH